MGYYIKFEKPITHEKIYLRYPSKTLSIPVLLEPDKIDSFERLEVPQPTENG